VPGNHDELIRDYVGMRFGNIKIKKDFVHVTAAGKRILVMHGDEFDSIIKCSRLAELIGTVSYDVLLYANRIFNHLRRKLGFPYWSLATYLKRRVKNAMQHVHNFEKAAVHEARRHAADGVICGHIHHAEARLIDDVLYCNTGDWVENCTALVEQQDGRIELIHWSDQSRECIKALLPDQCEADRKVA
jgi:UDP-2,3-diacylglucosamine pyrophosphatase LpxH